MADLIRAILDFLLRLIGRKPASLPETPEAETPAKPPSGADVVEDVVEDEDDEDTEPHTPVPSEPEPEPEEPDVDRPLLQRGDKGDAVKELQSLLNGNGTKLKVDGDFGGGTEGTVKDFQQSYGLERTGKADAVTWAILDRPLFSRDPQYQDTPLEPDLLVDEGSTVAKGWNGYGGLLSELAAVLGFKPAAAAAVLAVESAGEGFWDGRMVIRFENHIFRGRRTEVDDATFSAHFRMDSSQAWKEHQWRPDNGAWIDQHTRSAGQDGEWAVFEYASSLDRVAALKSISMGAPQIMGFNYSKIGYSSPEEMFDIFSRGDREHVLGLFDFFRSDHKMVRALRSESFVDFAAIYNGPGQAEHYGDQIEKNTHTARVLGVP
jgi:peptidoglycan hydrolase-like protein with peptidoglycan-binding domain